ncbi:Glutaredoxin-3 [Leclercia adecarboxylata]|uniref:Glutaredoxin-3 n=1 Tax=Leclercia adecarboxylata TaxID=83655 RepID=A0A4U9HE00_9ENTR|nr:Glutaredoxin-3 [Leclercia adecarboxylata]
MANIEIYTKATCPFCHSRESAAGQQSVAFQELPIDGDAAKRERDD